MQPKNHQKIIFEYYDFEENYALESAWAEKVDAGHRLDNILFYAKEYALGDIVSTENRNGELYVTGLVSESGHSTIRILFNQEQLVISTIEKLQSLGCDSEISNLPNLIAVDIPPSISYSKIKEFLEEGLINEIWGYEEACLAHNN